MGACYMLSHSSCVQLFAPQWTVAQQASLSMGFSKQEYWSRLSCLPPGDLLNLGIKPAFLTSCALASGFLTYVWGNQYPGISHKWECRLRLMESSPATALNIRIL